MAVRTAVDVLATVAADLLAAAPIGVAVLDPDLRYAYVNQALAEMNGLPVGEHLGRAVSDVLPDLAADVVPMIEDVLRADEGRMDVEVETGPVPRRPGRRCTWHVSYIPLRFGSPRVEGLAVLAQDVSELRENEALRDRQAFRMERLAALASGVAAAASVDEVADVIGALAGNALGASVTGVALPDGDVLRFVGAAARGGEGRWCPVRVADDQPLAVVARTGEPLFLPDTGAMMRPWPQLRPLQERYDEHAWAMLPLLRDRTVLGVLAFAFDRPNAFVTEDRQFLAGVAGLCSEAVQRAQLHEREHSIAVTLQRALLPAALPMITGWDVASRYRAAQRSADVGGDFYDLYRDGDDDVTAIIGDVCDGGLRAAAMVGQLRHSLRALTGMYGPAQALRHLNALLRREPSVSRLATAACVRLRPGATVTATVSCAGHPRPLLRRAGGRVESLGEHGTLLGAFGEIDVVETTGTLMPGDVLVLYTDGVTEARSASGQYGEERLARLLASTPPFSADALADRILGDVLAHQPEPTDDIALLVVAVSTG